MNFAFATLLILFLSLPGIAFRLAYFAGKFSTSGFATNFLDLLIWAVVPALFIHSLAILVVEQFFDYRILLYYFGYLLSGGNNVATIFQIFENIHSYLIEITFYNFILICVSIISGCFLRYFVRYYGWDIKYKAFRFPNEWHYIFTGEYINFSMGKGYHEKIDFIFVDILVEINGIPTIYSGKFEDYYLSKTAGGLDRVIIKYPTKKVFTAKGKAKVREIPGNYLSIPYEKIVNINYIYLNLSDL